MTTPTSQIVQTAPAGTVAVTAYTATVRTTVPFIAIRNVTGSPVVAEIYHDDDGTTFDDTTTIWRKEVAANSFEWVTAPSERSVISVAKDGSIGIRTATGSALTFTMYGETQSQVERGRT